MADRGHLQALTRRLTSCRAGFAGPAVDARGRFLRFKNFRKLQPSPLFEYRV